MPQKTILRLNSALLRNDQGKPGVSQLTRAPASPERLLILIKMRPQAAAAPLKSRQSECVAARRNWYCHRRRTDRDKEMRLVEYVGLLIIWAGALLAALSLHDARAMDLHSICGVWGCGPPTNALLAIHLSWAVVLWPPLLYVPWRFSWSTLVIKRIRRALIMIGIGGLVAITAWQWISWFPDATQLQKSYIWRRCGFVILTSVDWPFMQLLGGAAMLAMIPKRNTQADDAAANKRTPERVIETQPSLTEGANASA